MSFKFIDLCSGLGAFHIALSEMGGKCVYAIEKDKSVAKVYEKNFGLNPLGDIFDIDLKEIPYHDLLCAGFPCQSFSQGGYKKGFDDSRGTIFFEICKILEYHQPKYIILENVKNLIHHDNGFTYSVLTRSLMELGYILSESPIILSPHQLGVPQKRERLFILGVHNSVLKGEKLLEVELNIENNRVCSIYDILEGSVDSKYNITDRELKVLNAWEEVCRDLELTGHIWSSEFGKTDDYSGEKEWKHPYIKESRTFYNKYSEYLDNWKQKWDVDSYNVRDSKLEWQAGKEIHSIFETIIQFRQTGIRCKRPNYIPTLLAINQTPIIGKLKRRLTPRECARLQSIPDWYILDESDNKAYKQIGNSINVDVIKCVVKELKKYGLALEI